MTRPYVLSKQQYACRCGSEHPQLTRLAGVPVLLCPECPDDALHIHIDRVGGVRIVVGEMAAPNASDLYHNLEEAWAKENADLAARLATLQERMAATLTRLDALEAKLKRGARE